MDFDEIAITCHSSLGTPYLRWVKVGVPKINQELIDSTFFLYENAAMAKAGRNAQGTGFVVSHTVDISDGDGSRRTFTHHYAVTNAHVAHGAPVVRLNRGDDHEVFEFGECDWEYHPRDDVAVVPLDVQRREDEILASIDTRYFLDGYGRAGSIGVGDDVFMIGLFIDHAGTVTNNPMARFGNISMMASNRSLVAREDGTRVASYIVDMHSRAGFSGSPVFVYRTFGSDLSAHFARGENVTAVVQIPIITPQQLEAAMRTPVSRRPTTETLQLQLRTQPILRLLGIHWGQFGERWEVDRFKEEGTRRRRRSAGAVPEGVPRRQYISGLSGMTLVAPAAKIMEVLNMPKLVAKRAAKEKPSRERRHSGPILESAPSKSADDGVPPHDHKKAFNELLDSAIGARKKPARR